MSPRSQQQYLFRRSVAVVDAANPFSNFFLQPAQSKEVAAMLLGGEFLLLAQHRQSGKTTLSQSIVAELQSIGCLTAVIWLTGFRSLRSRGIFNMILSQIGIPQSDADDPKR